jgi:DNA-binding NarL/FixJ family response regulator
MEESPITFSFICPRCMKAIIVTFPFSTGGQKNNEPDDNNPGPRPKSKKIFTSRELDVLRLLDKGFTSREIGEQLYITVRTVEAHRASIGQKVESFVGRKSRAAILKFCREMGILP